LSSSFLFFFSKILYYNFTLKIKKCNFFCKEKIWALAFVLSFIIFILAKFSILHPDYFGYRLIFGVLFLFLAGSIIQDIIDKSAKSYEKFILFLSLFISLLLIVRFLYIRDYGLYTFETLTGFLIGSFILFCFLKNKPKLPFDKFFGTISYLVYLNHFTAIWILKYLGFQASVSLYILSVLILTILLSLIIMPVEKYITDIRYRFTKAKT